MLAQLGNVMPIIPILAVTSAPATPAWVALGAIAGALSRYYITALCGHYIGTRLPYGTALVNLSGSVLIGSLSVWLQAPLAADLQPLLMVGFLGSYTTFSTYELDALGLLRAGRYAHALAYWLGSIGLGFGAVKLGIAIAHQFG